ncbi:malto-oligosyltrehalose synthase [Cellvibrio sp. NN19]|uniref:malto-oligosyltrehalose synthase n=1 Tax=Cellvibrio chitinivorans TaxID=3102792 RepID=UPI002B409228|nr:malto-oligosyltrehalose synthase [Cellvibrio sp. NN19]
MVNIRATARLQFHRGFNFIDATSLISYFAKLGISHIYASPILTARPGSTYGYDVIDPTQVNPELGGEAALETFVAELRKHNMGLIVDFVPNHMAVGGATNPWWLSVLEWGKESPYARFFDIQWYSPDPLLKGQLLIPVLRAGYGEVLVAGDITLHFDEQQGSFHAQHFDHKFPLYPPTYNEILTKCKTPELQSLGRQFALLEKIQTQSEADGQSQAPLKPAQTLQKQLKELAQAEDQLQDILSALNYFCIGDSLSQLPVNEQYQDDKVKRIHRLLEHQHYRLADWRTASDDINWRRFFDINELGALRAERTDVFDAIHEKIFDLIGRGLIDGLRIDHIDGLANPRAYCRKLRRKAERLLPINNSNQNKPHFLIYVEKILAHKEQLPQNWLVEGSTGYDFMNQVSLVQHDASKLPVLANFWQRKTNRPADFSEEVIEARRLILSTSLIGDFETVAQGLLRIARAELATRDITLGAIRRALLELIVHFPVYRTYSRACPRTPQDQLFFEQALAGARTTLNEHEWPLLDQLDKWLGGEPLHQLPPGSMRKLRYRTLIRFQQLTSPIAAKSVEDTACYRSGILLSRNDVGFNPELLGISSEEFHAVCKERAEQFPQSMLTTATHDHKRGEDARARLAVLSEHAEWFTGKAEYWQTLAVPLHQSVEEENAPTLGDELMLYQTLLATWPLDLDADNFTRKFDNSFDGNEEEKAFKDIVSNYVGRIQQWQEKALREAKLRSNWAAPNTAYETACKDFVQNLFTATNAAELRNSIAATVQEIAPAGALNSITQTLLRLTTPGVPDLYQGTEYWDFSLVDPDNRNPVDFSTRIASLNDTVTEADELLNQWRDGRIKQHLINKTLNLRREMSNVFTSGDYLPLQVAGDHAEKIISFARRLEHQWIIVVAPRLCAHMLVGQPTPYISPDAWGDTRLVLPSSAPQNFTGLFSREVSQQAVHSEANRTAADLNISSILTDFPVNILFTST